MKEINVIKYNFKENDQINVVMFEKVFKQFIYK